MAQMFIQIPPWSQGTLVWGMSAINSSNLGLETSLVPTTNDNLGCGGWGEESRPETSTKAPDKPRHAERKLTFSFSGLYYQFFVFCQAPSRWFHNDSLVVSFLSTLCWVNAPPHLNLHGRVHRAQEENRTEPVNKTTSCSTQSSSFPGPNISAHSASSVCCQDSPASSKRSAAKTMRSAASRERCGTGSNLCRPAPGMAVIAHIQIHQAQWS
jgi:hypothetical protein